MPQNPNTSDVDGCQQRLEAMKVNDADAPPPSYASIAGRGDSKEGDDASKNASGLSVEAAEFVPRFGPAAGEASAAPFGDLPETTVKAYTAIGDKMAKSPIMADDHVPALVDKLKEEKTSEARVQALTGVSSIFLAKATSEYNARHAMARMVNVVLQNITTAKAEFGDEFWTALNSQLRLEHEISKETLAKNSSRYKNFAFFLAEVLGASSRMFGNQKADELSDLILLVLEDFFATEDGDQWKTAGMVLKQVGAYLEDNFAKRKNSTGVSSLDTFMSNVGTRGHSGREDIPFYIRSMLINIIELRLYNWGRSTAPVTTIQPIVEEIHVPVPHNDNSGMMSLNTEERAFLENEGCGIELADDRDEYDVGMDEEMQKDYELFLQMNSNSGQ